MAARTPLTQHTSTGSVTTAGALSTLLCGVAYVVLAAHGLPWYPGTESALTVLLTVALAAHRRRKSERCS